MPYCEECRLENANSGNSRLGEVDCGRFLSDRRRQTRVLISLSVSAFDAYFNILSYYSLSYYLKGL
jgi:hypothetical protein